MAPSAYLPNAYERVVDVFVTTAGTICQFIDCVEDWRRIDGLNMVLRFVIVDMATGAIWLVDSNLPVNSIHVCGVTIGTSHVEVLAWEERRAMAKASGGRPVDGVMTAVACSRS